MENVITVFEQIYQLTYDKVAFYVLSKCGTVPEVEDILQETYAELFKVLSDKGVAYISVPEGFVMQLAKSKVYRYYSEKERQQACVYAENAEVSGAENDVEAGDDTVEENWEDSLIDKLTAKEVMDYLAKKDELTRDIFYQHYFQDKTLKEIAESHGMKETTVKKRLYRTLQELRRMKRFVIIAVILLLAMLLAKPVHTMARNVIRRIKSYITDSQGRIMDDLVYYNFQGHSVELSKGDRIILPVSVWKEYERVAVCMPETDFFEEVTESVEYCFVAEEDGRYQVLAEDSKGNIRNITKEMQVERRGVDNPDKIKFTVTQTYEKSDQEGRLLTYYELADGSWKAGDYYYQHRIVLTGRMHNAASDVTLVVLSNLDDITFSSMEDSFFSSNWEKHYSVEEVRLVEMIH